MHCHRGTRWLHSPSHVFPNTHKHRYAEANILDETQQIEHGFTDGGRGRPARSAAAVAAEPFDLNEREVIVVDLAVLRADMLPAAIAAVAGLTNRREAFKVLAQMCSERLGGKKAMEDEGLTWAQVDQLRTASKTNCVSLHRMVAGVCRHRAVLFKLMCDEVSTALRARGFKLPCRLIRGDVEEGQRSSGHAWNMVSIDDARWLLCDVTHDSSKLYPNDSRKYKKYTRTDVDRDGRVRLAGAGGQSVVVPDAPAAIHDPNFVDASWLTRQRLLGKGGFGEVYLARYKGFQDVAVKYALIPSSWGKRKVSEAKRDFEKELELLKECVSPHVVQLLGWNLVEDEMFFVIEYMERGTLFKAIDNEDPEVTWGEHGRRIVADVARGLCYLHSKFPEPVLHLDIKTENVLLSEGYRAKLSDLGLSKKLAGTMTVPTGMSYGYTPPEIINSKGRKRATEKADVFSLGVVVVVVWTEEEPEPTEEVSCPGDVPKAFRELVKKCLSKKPVDRPTSLQVLNELETL
jgi:hypothetical protein